MAKLPVPARVAVARSEDAVSLSVAIVRALVRSERNTFARFADISALTDARAADALAMTAAVVLATVVLRDLTELSGVPGRAQAARERLSRREILITDTADSVTRTAVRTFFPTFILLHGPRVDGTIVPEISDIAVTFFLVANTAIGAVIFALGLGFARISFESGLTVTCSVEARSATVAVVFASYGVFANSALIDLPSRVAEAFSVHACSVSTAGLRRIAFTRHRARSHLGAVISGVTWVAEADASSAFAL